MEKIDKHTNREVDIQKGLNTDLNEDSEMEVEKKERKEGLKE